MKRKAPVALALPVFRAFRRHGSIKPTAPSINRARATAQVTILDSRYGCCPATTAKWSPGNSGH
jgi:hypothetical protein